MGAAPTSTAEDPDGVPLREGEAEIGSEAPTAPAARVRLPYVRHLRPLSSLDNIFAEEKVVDFVDRVRRAADVATLGEERYLSSSEGGRNDDAVAGGEMASPGLEAVREHVSGGGAELESAVDAAGRSAEGELEMVKDGRGARQQQQPPLAFVAEPKIDGLTCALLYEDGRLVRAATRGDGTRGEDVTLNALALGEDVVPRCLSPVALAAVGGAPAEIPARLEVRGEVYMPDEAFARLNRDREVEGLPAFATARNAAAGSLRQLDADVSRGRGLRFFAYGAAVGGEEGQEDAEASGSSLPDIFGTQAREHGAVVFICVCVCVLAGG